MEAEPTRVIWRSGTQLGAAVRLARERLGLTQAALAKRAAVGLKFLYELESGKDTLRADKVLDVLAVLGLELVVSPKGIAPEAREDRAQYRTATPPQDYIGMACTTAGVSLRRALAPHELVQALLEGRPTPGKHAHFVVLLEEAPPGLLQGLVAQVGAWGKPGQVERNIRKIASTVGVRVKAAQ